MLRIWNVLDMRYSVRRHIFIIVEMRRVFLKIS